MTDAAPDAVRRGRGRPRGVGGSRRDDIVAAATADFAEHGYRGATVRGIAARAGVDPALVHHYFGTKADLFASVLRAPVRPDRDAHEILDGPVDSIGWRLVRHVLTVWDDGETRSDGVQLLRAALSDGATSSMVASFLHAELLEPVAATLEAGDAELRVSLVSSQVLGLLLGRYVLALPALRDATVDDLVARVGPTIQRHLTGDPVEQPLPSTPADR
ncbi:TetR family transcriptional regulator [Nocardioides sp. CPCC 205120]|uniref:TetR/AcrR family transcriptional regulator n=1 Tax=Nocardioides sp. CPCC 205120 TaxID=3406462 RepID=UPI003B513A8D